MFKNFNNLVFGLIIGLALGLWFGVNIGQDQPVLSNPFKNQSLQEKVINRSGDLLEKSGQALKNTLPQSK